MTPQERAAAVWMRSFAQRTGIKPSSPVAQRYLWTDAFALCNFIGLADATDDPQWVELAFTLVDQVHHVLGRHRADDARAGWLSGLQGAEAEAHPTRGGLRIGKRLPERTANEPFDERLEWDRDGQYFHYLTRWMHALDQLARYSSQARFNTWALELAEVAYRAFVDRDATHMTWKMSIDLTRPLVASMGHHDPLDGFITTRQLLATAAHLGGPVSSLTARHASAGFARLMAGRDWVTSDALGIGGLLVDALRAELAMPGTALTEQLLGAALDGLREYLRGGELDLPTSRRLAFRELGLAIGLRAVERLERHEGLFHSAALPHLVELVPLAAELEAVWCSVDSHEGPAWVEHRDINEVMLATALAPDGYLAATEPASAAPSIAAAR